MESYKEVKNYIENKLDEEIIELNKRLMKLKENLVDAKEIIKDTQREFVDKENIEGIEENMNFFKKIKKYDDKIGEISEYFNQISVSNVNFKNENIKNTKKNNIEDKAFDSWDDILIKNNQIGTILNLTLAMMTHKNIDRWNGSPGDFREEIKSFVKEEFNIDIEQYDEWPATPSLVGRRLSQADSRGIIEKYGLHFRNRKPYDNPGPHKYYFRLL